MGLWVVTGISFNLLGGGGGGGGGGEGGGGGGVWGQRLWQLSTSCCVVARSVAVHGCWSFFIGTVVSMTAAYFAPEGDPGCPTTRVSRLHQAFGRLQGKRLYLRSTSYQVGWQRCRVFLRFVRPGS